MEDEDRETLEYVAKNINYITPFSGDKYSLSSFINRIESLFPIIEPLSNEHKLIVLGYITDKIIGKAKETMIRHGPVNAWVDLKRILIKNHGERTPILELIDELRLCRCDSTIEDFYQKINSLLSRINNAYTLSGENEAEIFAANQRLALKHFTENLPSLAKNLIGCRNPESLIDAYDLLTQFGYLSFTHNRNKSEQNNNPRSNNIKHNNLRHNQRNNQNNHTNFNRYNNNDINFERGQVHNNNYNNYNRQNNVNYQRSYRQEQRNNFRNNVNSGQIRNQNNHNVANLQKNFYRNDVDEPMDISANENNSLNQNLQLQPNFRMVGRNYSRI